jgi:hypothetical protein
MTPQARWFFPLAGCLALLLACTAPAGAQQKDTIYRTLKPDQIEQILKDMNIVYKKSQPPNLPNDYDYDYERNTYKIRFTLSNGKLLWISAVFPKTTLETINKWNVQAKFSRAVLDRSGDREFAVVEYQVDAGGGVTYEMIRQAIRRFDTEVANFDQFLKNN